MLGKLGSYKLKLNSTLLCIVDLLFRDFAYHFFNVRMRDMDVRIYKKVLVEFFAGVVHCDYVETANMVHHQCITRGGQMER